MWRVCVASNLSAPTRRFLGQGGSALARRALCTAPKADAAAAAAATEADPAADAADTDADAASEPKPESVGTASTMEFQAETRKLLDIVANSLYTDKEVFLRELISNASDALEKRRHAALTSSDGDDVSGLKILIEADEKANTLVISDSGIGMSRDDLVANLGTIARSGSKNFLQQLQDEGKANADVIGQFGVGFYSVFMVADKVTVYSRRQGEATGHCWSSRGDGTYELSEAANVAEGTKLVIELKADEGRFARPAMVKANIQKYSNFVSFPIELGASASTLSVPSGLGRRAR